LPYHTHYNTVTVIAFILRVKHQKNSEATGKVIIASKRNGHPDMSGGISDRRNIDTRRRRKTGTCCFMKISDSSGKMIVKHPFSEILVTNEAAKEEAPDHPNVIRGFLDSFQTCHLW
jgi:hypothetical protein